MEHSATTVETLFARYGSGYRWLATVTVMLGTISTILTATIVNVALPDIMGAFGMGQDQAQLLATGFLGAMTATMLLNAWLVDSFGQRLTFMSAISVFVIGSVMGGSASGEEALILARVLQGGAAGILQPFAMQVIFQVFPPQRRGAAMGIYGIGVVLAPALGPTIGGIMVDNFSWRDVFFLPLPFCALGLFMATLFLPGPATNAPTRKFDWVGFSLMAIFLVALLDGLSNGQRRGWLSDRVLLDFATAMVAGMGFLAWELKFDAPMLNLQIFSNRTFAAGCIVAFVFGAGIYGSTYLVPLFVQTIQGYSATRSGLLLMPAGIILALVFPVAGRLTDRVPVRAPVMLGLAVFAYSAFLMKDVDTNTSFLSMAWWILLGRVGLGFIMPGLNAGALRALPMHSLGQGSGAINFVRQLGGAFGVNLLAIFLEIRSQLHTQAFTAAQTAGNESTAELLRLVRELLARAGVPEAIQTPGALSYLGRVVYAQGNMMGYRDAFMVVAWTFLLALIPACMMRGTRPDGS